MADYRMTFEVPKEFKDEEKWFKIFVSQPGYLDMRNGNVNFAKYVIVSDSYFFLGMGSM